MFHPSKHCKTQENISITHQLLEEYNMNMQGVVKKELAIH